MHRKHPSDQLVIGWQEYVALPEWKIPYIRAKADTGARSSAIDVRSIEELGNGRVRFQIALSRKNRERTIPIEADITRRSRVRSAHGTTQDRLFVQTKIRIGPVTKTIEVSLVCRKKMICRMLLGRTSLAGAFLVDSETRYNFGDREHHKAIRKKKKTNKSKKSKISKKSTGSSTTRRKL